VHVKRSDEIATRVNELLSNEALCKKMAQRSYELVLKRYTWGKIAEQFESIYKKHASNTKEYLRLVKAGAQKAKTEK
jgi:glycosyltransferase involved in cell wall biosynthesis